MENNTMNNETKQGAQQETQQAGERTFTQDEVNQIVQERLARAKTSSEPDQRELDLQARENALYVREALENAGFNNSLAYEFKGMDKATVDKCLKIIAPFAQKMKEPIYNAVGPTNSGDGGVGSDSAIRAAMGLRRR